MRECVNALPSLTGREATLLDFLARVPKKQRDVEAKKVKDHIAATNMFARSVIEALCAERKADIIDPQVREYTQWLLDSCGQKSEAAEFDS